MCSSRVHGNVSRNSPAAGHSSTKLCNREWELYKDVELNVFCDGIGAGGRVNRVVNGALTFV